MCKKYVNTHYFNTYNLQHYMYAYKKLSEKAKKVNYAVLEKWF